ncbi:hypothetical protein ABGB14_37580 [Nonomuraea sp. B10E15]|uniref:hypothetical protein n=1 Tax=Nonomuraea sp. B10E15 TaxID=3153560 RepID=UPI00325CEFFE
MLWRVQAGLRPCWLRDLADGSWLAVITQPTGLRRSQEELARCYHDRWEAETGIDQLRTHLRGPGRILRSRTPELACQEI